MTARWTGFQSPLAASPCSSIWGASRTSAPHAWRRAVLTVAWPLPFVPHALRVPVGCLLVATAAALLSFSIKQFRMAGTPVPGNTPTTAIVRTGPYRFSRNPIYLAFFALQLGLAILVDSLWLVATLIPTVAIIAVAVVPREERYLAGRFGAEYLEYRASVRRWL